jgi:hypothetical protein
MRATQYTKEIGGNPDYYLAYTLTNLYVEKTFGGFLSTITITNDSTVETVSFSYDGATLAGTVKPGESVTVNVDQRSSIYVKGSVGTDSVRLWGWAGVVRSAGPDTSGNVPTAGTSTGVSVGATSTTVLAANSSRSEAIIVNDSNETVYLKYGSGAEVNKGIRLNASGGSVTEDKYTGIITGICASGSKTVTVTEL